MTARRALGWIAFGLVVLAVALFLLAACQPDSQQAGSPSGGVVRIPSTPDEAEDDGWSFGDAADDEDKPDCDREDRAANEVPDCGFRYAGRFYAWSWVLAGKTTPPAGWRPAQEQRSVISRLGPPTAPATTAATVRPAATSTTAAVPAPRVITKVPAGKPSSKKPARPVARRR